MAPTPPGGALYFWANQCHALVMMARMSFLSVTLVVACALGLASGEARARPVSPSGDPCARSATEQSLLRCREAATAAQARTIARLNAKLVARASDDGGYQKALREAQAAWLRHRDAECRVDTWESRDGSAFRVQLVYCQQQRNERRIAELTERVSTP